MRGDNSVILCGLMLDWWSWVKARLGFAQFTSVVLTLGCGKIMSKRIIRRVYML